MGRFRTNIENTEADANTIKNDAQEDFKVLVKVDKYIDEILEECAFRKFVPHTIPKNIDKVLMNALLADYNTIVKNIKRMRESQTGVLIEMRNVEALYPAVEQHIRDGYLEFDEYEDMVE